jgi:DNA polymerase-3 subunit delta
MPKLEPKQIQKELEKGKVRPVYFIFGPERMKARELIKKIKTITLQGEPSHDFNSERWDGSLSELDSILDSAQSISMSGSTKYIFIGNAEDLSNLDPLAEYLRGLNGAEPVSPDALSSVMVFLSKGFDGRKKASKTISEVAAVVSCDAVEEQDREVWIDFLAKRRAVQLTPSERLILRGIDPWSLDTVDQELQKLDLVGQDESLRSEVLLNGVSAYAQDDFIDAIFTRDHKRALKLIHLFTENIETQLPFLGLLSWNLRQLKVYLLEQETRSPSLERRNPMLQNKLDRWKRFWSLKTIQALEHHLFEIDFSLKNTRLTGLGLWTELILLFQKSGELS